MVVPKTNQIPIELSTACSVEPVQAVENARPVVRHIFPAVAPMSAWLLCTLTGVLWEILSKKEHTYYA